MRCWPPRPPGPQTYMTYHDLNIFGWMTTWIASCLSDILLWNLLTRICTLGWPMFDQSLQQRPPVQAGSKPFSIIHSPINCFLWQPGQEFQSKLHNQTFNDFIFSQSSNVKNRMTWWREKKENQIPHKTQSSTKLSEICGILLKRRWEVSQTRSGQASPPQCLPSLSSLCTFLAQFGRV